MEENNFYYPNNQLSFSKNMLFQWKPNSYNALHKQKNKSDQKTLFSLDRKYVSTSRMKGCWKIYEKATPSLKILWKIQKIGVH